MPLPTSSTTQPDDLRATLRVSCANYTDEYHRGLAENDTFPEEYVAEQVLNLPRSF